MFSIKFYRNRRGREPVGEYLTKLQNEADESKDSRIKLQKIYEYIGMLEENGTRAGEPYVKHLVDGIWELRPLRTRVLFFFWAENTFILLHSFIKKTQKTPQAEIDKAVRERDDFLKRKERERDD